ncbi:hypothetical protein NDR87_03240 [Nocardia sp. CDC159]|uniref:Uncharacterized protein n=1 Tax=Nocardia pulmonis TaxID=2951408 RepID=A0A9X2IWK1_9NOCA|nr:MULTISPECIES: hypothetical protein [Nocardia]MCM6771971.1 hypothetical protein [Nocardia pulmonis]MCM6785371.1 hypothetical protein [Nocardia sp. CDC159]
MTAQPVLIGPVPLLYVQSISMTEGYQIQRIGDSKFSQAVAPTRKAIAIEAMLLGPERLVTKKALEVLALNSRLLVAATATTLAATGIPVVCGLTISLDMQITDLRFTQSVHKRDAIDVSLGLEHVPRGRATAIAGEIADLALAAGSAIFGGPAAPAAVPAVPAVPL